MVVIQQGEGKRFHLSAMFLFSALMLHIKIGGGSHHNSGCSCGNKKKGSPTFGIVYWYLLSIYSWCFPTHVIFMKIWGRDFPVAQWMGLRAPSAIGPASIPGLRTRSHVHAATESSHATAKEPWSRSQGGLPAATGEPARCCNWGAGRPQLRSPPATTRTQCNQKKKKKKP